MTKLLQLTFAALLGIGVLPAQRVIEQPPRHPQPLFEAELLTIKPVTSGVREDDHPVIASANGVAWLAWVSYSENEGTSHIYARRFEGGEWGEVQQVTESAGDYYKPAIAVAGDATVRVIWPAQVNGNWDLYGRTLKPGAAHGAIERLTDHPGPDMMPQMAANGNRMMLVWQGIHGRGSDIFYRVNESGAWGPEGAVTENPSNDWEPAVAASKDGFHVAWDSYRGDYDIFLRSFAGGSWGAEMAVANSPRLENHVSLAVDSRDRLWLAFEVGPEKWAYDSANGGLRARRDIGLACWSGGKLYRPLDAEKGLAKLAGEAGMQAPALYVRGDGRPRLFYRQPMNRNFLDVKTTAWDGSGWQEPETLPYSEGRIDQRIVVANTGHEVVAAYPAGSSHSIIFSKTYTAGNANADRAPELTAQNLTPKPARPAPARHTLNGYKLVWGDLHRHTDISEDGGLDDGSLIDAMRYAMDAAEMDFLGITDHTRYLPRRYNLYRLQQIADLFNKAGSFVGVHAYERSQMSPWGHRNVVHRDRDYLPVPASYDIGDLGANPFGLFEALRGQKALTIPHTSAWVNKQVSWDYNDPEVERLVEIYQGLRSTYEYNGAPDPAGRVVYETDSRNFVWNALERKLKLGFIASSDHRSTHMSFAAVYVNEFDRNSIFDGLYARRTYAATDKIFVDFTIDGQMMGEEIEVGRTPELKIAVEGTAAIAQLDIIKNNTFVYTSHPNAKKAAFTFRDHQYLGDDAYYYVRVIQTDRNMAWASPIWVRQNR